MDKDALIKRLQAEVRRMALVFGDYQQCQHCGRWMREDRFSREAECCVRCLEKRDEQDDVASGMSLGALIDLLGRMACVSPGLLALRRVAPDGVRVVITKVDRRRMLFLNPYAQHPSGLRLPQSSLWLLIRLRDDIMSKFHPKMWVPAEWLRDGSMRLIGEDGAALPDWAPGAANGASGEPGEEATA